MYIYKRALVDEKVVFFTGNYLPDIIQVFKNPFNENILSIKSFINNKWLDIFQKPYNVPIKIIDIANLLPGKTKQIVVGNYSVGSSETLRFEVLGWMDNEVRVLLDKFDINEGYPFGKVKINNKLLYVTSLTQGTVFYWNGNSFASQRYINNPDPNLIKANDIAIHYIISSEGKISSSLPPHSRITLWLGQKIVLIRENIGPVERVLISGDIFSDSPFKEPQILNPVKPGKGTIIIIPNLYDWNNSIQYLIEVIK